MILFNLLSNMITLVSRLSKRFCILTRVGSDRVFLPLFKLFFFNFHPLTFYLLDIDIHIFFSFLFSLYEVIIFSFNLLKNGLWTFFSCVYFYEIISILYLWSQSLRVNPICRKWVRGVGGSLDSLPSGLFNGR